MDGLPGGKMPRLEKDIQLSIIKYLRRCGYACGKTKTIGVWDAMRRRYRLDKYAFVGFPDLTAFIPQLVFIECKSLTGRQTDEQEEFQAMCERVGIPYILATSVDDVIEGVEEVKVK